MNIAYLAHRIPYPPNKGDKIRSYHHLRHLAQRHDVSLFAFVDDPEDLAGVGPLKEFCRNVEVVVLGRAVALARGALALAMGGSFSEGFYSSSVMAQLIASVARERPFDVAWAFSSVMAQYLDLARAPRRIADCVDVDSEKWQQYADDSKQPQRFFYGI